jgi:hypothetical protein
MTDLADRLKESIEAANAAYAAAYREGRKSMARELLPALRQMATALTEAANCLRPTLPSLSDNILAPYVDRAQAAIAKIEKEVP